MIAGARPAADVFIDLCCLKSFRYIFIQQEMIKADSEKPYGVG